ncbi:hypothetical protein OE88DRAFT_232291 [Heliocybe sulcata]|uniref:Secreted protein n=1 Tax=Heliocybe sulcata TaxID=5364 RepID=A0A5C3MY90_9AGAM|nr:hypothetical protein OE88DRAFT_232291 [Heliocybe sulcata]
MSFSRRCNWLTLSQLLISSPVSLHFSADWQAPSRIMDMLISALWQKRGVKDTKHGDFITNLRHVTLLHERGGNGHEDLARGRGSDGRAAQGGEDGEDVKAISCTIYHPRHIFLDSDLGKGHGQYCTISLCSGR